jgi:hypothetical protein
MIHAYLLYRPAISRSPPLATRSLARSHARGVPGTIVLEPSEVRFRAGSERALDVRPRAGQGEESRREKKSERKNADCACLRACR